MQRITSARIRNVGIRLGAILLTLLVGASLTVQENMRTVSTVKLSAVGTDAGDSGQNVQVAWWIYREAGTLVGATLTQSSGLTTEVVPPATTTPGTVHVILEAKDDGTPRLFAYRRIVIVVAL